MAFGQGKGATSAQTVTVNAAGKQVLFGSLDRRKAILILGLGLMAAVNLHLGAVWKSGWSGVVDQSAIKNPGANAKGLLAEFALLAFLFGLSYAGDDAANASLLVVLGLWAVWWINQFAPGSEAASAHPSETPTGGPLASGSIPDPRGGRKS